MISTVAGGVFITKVKLLSAKAVITTGIGRPASSFWVWALNALQNSMMFKPRWPSAGPIGGLGFALPAGTCSLMNPTTFFAIPVSQCGFKRALSPSPFSRYRAKSDGPPRAVRANFIRPEVSREPHLANEERNLGRTSCLLDLREVQLHRRRPPEDRDRDAQLALPVVHVFDVAVEVGERAFLHAHRFAQLEEHLRTRLLDALLNLLEYRVDVLLRNRRRLVGRAADEPGDLRRALHQVPRIVGHLHLYQHVAGKELPLRDRPRPVLHLDHFLDGNEDLAELIGHAGALDPLSERALHALLESGVGMHHVPLLVAHPSLRPVASLTSHARVESIANRTRAMTTTNANTTSVV